MIQLSESREMEEESVFKGFIAILERGGHGSAYVQPAAGQATNTSISLPVAAYDPTRTFQSEQTCCRTTLYLIV